MHVLVLAPDTHAYNHAFLGGLRSIGLRVSGIGPAPRSALSEAVRPLLDDYRECPHVLEAGELLAHARELARNEPIERVETIEEPLVETAAALREMLGVPGVSVSTSRLCRDKVAMKEFLRACGIPCAQSASAGSERELVEFGERVGFPIIVKPVAGFGSLGTHRIDDAGALARLAPLLGLHGGSRVAVEEFVEGHEGFFDTIVGPDGVRHDFVGHYFPGCLEANRARWISPQIAISNRIDQDGYRELRDVGRRVVDALGLRCTATHMEWFFGPKGLKFSEIGARPAGERIWDMYRVANDFDVFREWALAVAGRDSERGPSRRLSVGSIQIRPDRDGVFEGHLGVRAAFERCGAMIYEHELPAAGSRTAGLDRGWHCNAWFRLAHPDFDELKRALDFLGETVKSRAK